MANVKPGDLAYIVAPYFIGGRGRFVTVVRQATGEDLRANRTIPRGNELCWYVTGDVVTASGSYREGIICDDVLRPICPPDDQAVTVKHSEMVV